MNLLWISSKVTVYKYSKGSIFANAIFTQAQPEKFSGKKRDLSRVAEGVEGWKCG